MRRWRLLAVLPLACGDPGGPDVGMLDVRIIAADAPTSRWELDPLVLIGEATGPVLGALPDDSLSWFLDEVPLATGRVLHTTVTAGLHVFRLRARYGEATATATLTVTGQPGGLGRVLWHTPLGAASHGLSADADGNLYTIDDASRSVIALNADGSVRWRRSLDVVIAGPAAVAPDGNLLFGWWLYAGGGVVALGPDGSERWRFDATTASPGDRGIRHVHGGVAVDASGNVYLGTEESDAPVYSVGPDGAFRWRAATSPARFQEILGPVSLAGGVVSAYQRADSVIGLDPADGTRRWSRPIGSLFFSERAAAAVGDTVVVSSANALRSMRAAGQPVWLREGYYLFRGSPLVGGGHIVVPGGGGTLRFALSGTLVDTLAVDTDGIGSCLGGSFGANGVLYLQLPDTIKSLDAAGVERFATALPPGTTGCPPLGGPVILADGTIVIRHMDGVYALRDTVGPATDAPWPTYQGGFARRGYRD